MSRKQKLSDFLLKTVFFSGLHPSIEGVGYHDPDDYWWVHQDDMANAQDKVKEYFASDRVREIAATWRLVSGKWPTKQALDETAPAQERRE